MMKSHNFIDNANCPAKNDCLFYSSDKMTKQDVFFYVDNCLRYGGDCGLYRNWKQTKDNPKYQALERKLKGGKRGDETS